MDRAVKTKELPDLSHIAQTASSALMTGGSTVSSGEVGTEALELEQPHIEIHVACGPKAKAVTAVPIGLTACQEAAMSAHA